MHAGYLPAHYWEPGSSCRDESLTGYTLVGWYFWDETESSVVGPYAAFGEAENARLVYGLSCANREPGAL